MQPPPKGHKVPARLRKILLRGLSVKPVDRYPSMDALLADITHAGWLPGAFFDALLPSGSTFILGVTVPFVFIDPNLGSGATWKRKTTVNQQSR